MSKEKSEFLILKSIQDGKETIRQRDLAKIAGISLGMTNAIIKKLVEKGFVKAKHINSKNIHYLLTPKGVSTLTKRSTVFLRRTIKNVVIYKDAIEKIVENIKKEGYTGIIIDEESDFNFLIEYICLKKRLGFNETLNGRNKEITDKDILEGIIL